jgi:hypothetical protein
MLTAIVFSLGCQLPCNWRSDPAMLANVALETSRHWTHDFLGEIDVVSLQSVLLPGSTRCALLCALGTADLLRLERRLVGLKYCVLVPSLVDIIYAEVVVVGTRQNLAAGDKGSSFSTGVSTRLSVRIHLLARSTECTLEFVKDAFILVQITQFLLEVLVDVDFPHGLLLVPYIPDFERQVISRQDLVAVFRKLHVGNGGNNLGEE